MPPSQPPTKHNKDISLEHSGPLGTSYKMTTFIQCDVMYIYWKIDILFSAVYKRVKKILAQAGANI